MAHIQCEKCKQLIDCSYNFNLKPDKAVLAIVKLNIICPKCANEIEVSFIPIRNDMKEKLNYIPLVKSKETKNKIKREKIKNEGRKANKPNYIA